MPSCNGWYASGARAAANIAAFRKPGAVSPSSSITSSPASIKAAPSLATLPSPAIYCNVYKGPNISGLDPLTGKLTPLFNPRRHKWTHHFRYQGGELIGRTAIGRTTADLLRINQPNRIALSGTADDR